MNASEVLRVRVVADAPAARSIVESVHTGIPGCTVATMLPSALALKRFDTVDCTVVGPSFASHTGVELLRALRAAGMDGPLVCVNESGAPPDADCTTLGVVDCVALDGAPSALAEAITSATMLDEDSPSVRALRRAQRLMAIGEITAGLQHALNNALTPLLAEAQLLEMETLPDEQRAAVHRIVESSRRLVTVVRRLDVVGEVPRAAAPHQWKQAT